MGGLRNALKSFVGNPECKRPLEGLDVGGEYNIRMDFREIGWKGMYWIHLAQDRDQ
jgi:hypothetical protein